MPHTPDVLTRPPLAHRFAGRTIALAALLVALTLAVYLQVGRFGFIPIDDRMYVTEEAHIRNGLSTAGAVWAFSTFYDCNWIPLTWISLMLDATLYGSWPEGHHLFNVALHVANVLLVFIFFLKATGRRGPSAFVAALFAVHPLHVESVAWIAERKDVLSVFFGLSALCAYMAYARNPRPARLVLVLALYLCSLLSKQTLVTFPFVLLLLDYWPLGRLNVSSSTVSSSTVSSSTVSSSTVSSSTVSSSTVSSSTVSSYTVWSYTVKKLGRCVLEKLPFFFVSAAFCAVELLAQARGQSTRSLAEITLATRCMNGLVAYALYLKRAALPLDLAAFYPHPGTHLSLLAVAAASACLGGITVFAIAGARRRPFVLVGWLWFLGTLVPMIGVVQVGIQQMADRYAYFPLLGLYAACAFAIGARWATTPRRARLLCVPATGLVALYAALAFVQVGYWRDGVTLMRRTLAVTPDNSFARFSLGDALYADSRTDEAIAEFQQAVRLAPDDPEGPFRLGWVYQELKQYDEAATWYRASLAIDETIAATHNRLGWILWARHEIAPAASQFARALALDDRNVAANVNLAGLSRSLGHFRQSIAYCQRALEIDPELFDVERLIAFNLRDLGRLDEAIAQLRHVLTQSPHDPEARSELAHLLEMRGDATPDLVSERPAGAALEAHGN